MILALLLTKCFGELIVKYNNTSVDVHYSLGNFGRIPYGHTLVGLIVLPQHSEGVDMDHDLCNEADYQRFNNNYSMSIWIIAKRGNCTFTTKALNAQKMGAQLLIVVDNFKGSREIVMGDDGFGFNVYIPSLYIDRTQGDPIIDATYQEAIIGRIKFNDTAKQEKPSVYFGLNLQNRDSFKFLREFKQYYDKLGQTLTYDIFYDLVQLKDTESIKDECLGGGKYCITSHPFTKAKGKDYVIEILRQLCYWNLNQTQFFAFVDYFDRNCVTPVEYQECAKKYSNFEFVTKAQECVDVQTEKIQSDVDNYLSENMKIKTTAGNWYFPAVLVNKVIYRGQIDAYNVYLDICSAYVDAPDGCNEMSPSTQKRADNSNQHVWLIVFTIVTCFLFGIFLFYCYRRRIKRQMQQELGQQVNEMVSQYIKFYETKKDDQ